MSKELEAFCALDKYLSVPSSGNLSAILSSYLGYKVWFENGCFFREKIIIDNFTEYSVNEAIIYLLDGDVYFEVCLPDILIKDTGRFYEGILSSE